MAWRDRNVPLSADETGPARPIGTYGLRKRGGHRQNAVFCLVMLRPLQGSPAHDGAQAIDPFA
jgi:hypothetical protein